MDEYSSETLNEPEIYEIGTARVTVGSPLDETRNTVMGCDADIAGKECVSIGYAAGKKSQGTRLTLVGARCEVPVGGQDHDCAYIKGRVFINDGTEWIDVFSELQRLKREIAEHKAVCTKGRPVSMLP